MKLDETRDEIVAAALPHYSCCLACLLFFCVCVSLFVSRSQLHNFFSSDASIGRSRVAEMSVKSNATLNFVVAMTQTYTCC